MVIALLAPEVLLYLAINERVNAARLMKTAQKFHPGLVKPGMLSRVYRYIRAKLKDVSAPFETSTT
jgi:hypothetical protein